jgi:hypothetical protein
MDLAPFNFRIAKRNANILLITSSLEASSATTFSLNNHSLRFKVDRIIYLVCIPLLSISSVSNDAEATTCLISIKY